MRLKTRALILAIAVGALCSAAVAQDVKYNIRTGNDFSKYKTYKWQHAEKATYKDGPFDQIMMRSADAQLTKKGLTRTEDDNADLYIVYQLSLNEDVRWSSFSTQSDWMGSMDTFPGSSWAVTNNSYMIRKGYLMIDLYDTKQKMRVWEAEASKTLDDKLDLQKIERNAQKVMAKVFKKYPSK